MRDTGPVEGNAAQIEHWRGPRGVQWAARQDAYDRQLAGFTEALFDAAAPASGETVLDIGCGGGTTTVRAARAVGPGGAVTGVDVSDAMLATAARQVAEAGLGNVRLLEADAQVADLGTNVDLCISRFGVMFFAHPVAAFANIRGALRPDGRIAWVCWSAFADQEWMQVPLRAAREHVDAPMPDFGAPGPFALGDGERLHGLLDAAGFRSIELDPVTRPMLIAGGGPPSTAVDDATDALSLSPLGQWFGDAARERLGPGGDGAVEAARRAVHEALAGRLGPDGVTLDGAVWLVRAHA